MSCLDDKSSLYVRVGRQETAWSGLLSRVGAMKQQLEAIRDSCPPDSPCYAQAQAKIDNLSAWEAENGPLYLSVLAEANNAASAIDCQGSITQIGWWVGTAEIRVGSLEDWVEARDQEIGMLEADASQFATDCPVLAHADGQDPPPAP